MTLAWKDMDRGLRQAAEHAFGRLSTMDLLLGDGGRRAAGGIGFSDLAAYASRSASPRDAAVEAAVGAGGRPGRDLERLLAKRCLDHFTLAGESASGRFRLIVEADGVRLEAAADGSTPATLFVRTERGILKRSLPEAAARTIKLAADPDLAGALAAPRAEIYLC